MHTTQTPAWVDRQAFPFAAQWFTLASGTRLHYVDEGSFCKHDEGNHGNYQVQWNMQ